jgi:hypothetical protein
LLGAAVGEVLEEAAGRSVAGDDRGPAGATLEEGFAGADVEFGQSLTSAVATGTLAGEGGLDGGGEELRGIGREGQQEEQAHSRNYTLLSEVLLAGVGPGDDELREE